MADFARILEVAQELRELVARDSRLDAFRIGADQFVAHAGRAVSGDLSFGALASPSTGRLPDHAVAAEVVRLAGIMPGPDGTESEQELHALGQLHGNLVEAAMHAVFADYPETVHDAMAQY